MTFFSKYIKNKKKREDVELYESLFLRASYEYVKQKTDNIVSSRDDEAGALLQMGKYYGMLRRLVEK